MGLTPFIPRAGVSEAFRGCQRCQDGEVRGRCHAPSQVQCFPTCEELCRGHPHSGARATWVVPTSVLWMAPSSPPLGPTTAALGANPMPPAEIVGGPKCPVCFQRPDTGLKAPPALGGSAMVARPTRRQIFAVNC